MFEEKLILANSWTSPKPLVTYFRHAEVLIASRYGTLNNFSLTGGVSTMRSESGSAYTALRCTTRIHVACMLYSRWRGMILNERRRVLFMVVCYVGQLYTYLRCWKFWTIVWQYTNGVHFRAVWKNTAHVQGIRCLPIKTHTLFLGWVLYFLLPHSNEHRLHVVTWYISGGARFSPCAGTIIYGFRHVFN